MSGPALQGVEKWPGMSMTWESVRVSFHENARKMHGTDHRDSGAVGNERG